MGGPGSFLDQIETLFDAGVIGEEPDRRLLERFAGRDRAAAELAFTVLLKRHGPMVYRACRAILGDPHEAEDAFQATFLVLARKARGLWVGDSLGPWLLSVARRTAGCARTAESRRRARERTAAVLATAAAEDPGRDDREAVLHEELGRLPEKYRTAVLLCDLEGLTQEQAARRLGWPDGTVRSRLARGRERLRERLTRRGIAPAVVLAARPATFDVAYASMVEPIVQTAVQLGSGGSASGVPPSVMALTKGALRIMFGSKLKAAAAVALTGTLLCGSGWLGYRAMGRQQAPAVAAGQQPTKSAGPDTGKATAAPGGDSPELVALGKARVELARELLDSADKLWSAGSIGLTDYLAAQKRFNEIVLEVNVKTDADRIRFYEELIKGAKRIEERVRILYRAHAVSQMEMDVAGLNRLDAEYGLAKARSQVGGQSR